MTRQHGGNEITEDFVDDLVDEWHDVTKNIPMSLGEFIRLHTGWDELEYHTWVGTGRIPE